MDHEIVERLEQQIEAALTEIMTGSGHRKLPLIPSRRTLHLMAKAAVTVFEAAVENDEPQPKQKQPF